MLEANDTGTVLRSLPLLTLHLTERCNSRCVSCDYWRHGRVDLTSESVLQLLPSLRALGTRTVLISGGEPLIHPQWIEIAEALRANGQRLWLLTSGLSLAKHAARAAQLFDSITVSMDGADKTMYAAIRGLDAFDVVCAGIRAATGEGAWVSTRVTVQRANYTALPELVSLSRALGAKQISFLAADISNPHAFGRVGTADEQIALTETDLPNFAAVLDTMERVYADDFASGFIAEHPAKLRRLLQYYAAVLDLAPYPPVRCNAPEFSAVMNANGTVQPCFFIAGENGFNATADFTHALNSEVMRELRSEIRGGRRPECATCVCSLWRARAETADFSLRSERRALA